ncbi:MAG: hypothetical protein OHK0046_02850 [Anaerolineae bacterium]
MLSMLRSLRLSALAQSHWLRDALFVLLALLLVLLYVQVGGGGFPLDDSWIHQVYGRNLGERGEWAFIPGEPSGASTSPLYTVLLAVGYALNVPYVFWTHLLGVLALASTAMLGARLVRLWVPDVPWLAWIAGLALLLTWHLVWAAASGMETMLFCALTLLLIWLAARASLTAADGLAFGAASALAIATRPEGALLAGLCGLMVLVVHRQAVLQWCMGVVIGFAVFIAPYLLLNLELTGGLLPTTAAAKQAQHAPLLALPLLDRLVDLQLPVIVGGQVFLLPGALYATTRRRPFLLLPLLWAAGLILLYALRLPAAYQHGRYVMPVLPGLVVLGTVGTYYLLHAALWRSIGQRLGEAAAGVLGRVITRTLLLSTALTFVYFGVLLGPTIYRQDVRIIEEEMVASAEWIAANLPPEDLLAIHDIGAVGYFAPRPMLDVAGLVTEEVVPLIGDADGLWALIQARDARYLMAFPDQIPGHDPDDPRLCFLYQTPGMASTQVGGPKMVIYRLAWDSVC